MLLKSFRLYPADGARTEVCAWGAAHRTTLRMAPFLAIPAWSDKVKQLS